MNTTIASPETGQVHGRIYGELYQALRLASYTEKLSQNKLLTEALEMRLAPYLKGPDSQ